MMQVQFINNTMNTMRQKTLHFMPRYITLVIYTFTDVTHRNVTGVSSIVQNRLIILVSTTSDSRHAVLQQQQPLR